MRVGALALEPGLARLAAEGRLTAITGPFDPSWLDDAWLVIAATGDAAVNREIAAEARSRRIFAIVVDDAELSSVQLPARIQRGPLQIAVSSGGGSPMLARHLRERLETQYHERRQTY